MKTPFSFFFVAALMILASLSACKKENSATPSSSSKTQTATPSQQKQQAPIAYVEVDSLLTQYKFCTENKSVLEAKSKQYQSQVAAKMAQVQKAYADFQQKMQNGTFTTREGQAGSGEKGGEEEPKKWHKKQKQAKFVSKLLCFCRIVLLFCEKVVDFLG